MDELKLPELGENIEAADVTAVLVSLGDVIHRDQPVIEVETEKASLEVPATCDGRVTELKVKQGDKVSVGQVILVVETEPGAAGERPNEAEPPASEEQPGQTESGPPPESGASESSRPAAEPASVVAFPAKPRRDKPEIGRTVAAAPSVRALARELGLDIHEVPGTGHGGRISRDDVKSYAKKLLRGIGAGRPAGRAEAGPVLPDFTRWGEVKREPWTSIRRATAENMASSWNAVPHVTQFDRADITHLEAMRKRFNDRPETAGRKLTVTAMVLKLSAAALAQFPKFNASLDMEAGEVIYRRYIHIGVAVDTERGLLVPVLRDVDKKGLLHVAAELADVAARARNKKVKPDELRGAGFTVTNLGGLGTTYFSPIVNWPEVAVLGVGRAEVRAVHEENQFKPRLILPLSLSYDHRLIDGADAARFLRWIAEALEQPLLLLLEDGADS